MPTKERVVQALKDALAAMNDSGAHWTQGVLREQMQDGKPRFCSLGAVYFVTDADMDRICDEDHTALKTGDYELREEAVIVLAGTIPEDEREVIWTPSDPDTDEGRFRSAQHVLTSWNDRAERTWGEIVALFEQAQQRVVEEGQSE